MTRDDPARAPPSEARLVATPASPEAIPPTNGTYAAKAGRKESVIAKPIHMRPAPPARNSHLIRFDLDRAIASISFGLTLPLTSMKRLGDE